MPVLTRETLAMRFRQNWMAKHPVDAAPSGGELDDSLTSLNWLHSLNIMKLASPTPPHSPPPGDLAPTASLQVNPNAVLNMAGLHSPGLVRPPTTARADINVMAGSSCRLPGSLLDVAPPTSLDRIDYKNNSHVKPPYSYATLICMAMKESKKNKITLSGIYNWITDNFMYYRVADPSWQNSIRHNLSLNKCFQKVPRKKDEPGKGGFWRIHPDYQDMFVNGVFKKRRGSTPTLSAPPPPLKRLKREEETSVLAILPPSAAAGAGPSSVLLSPDVHDYAALGDIRVKTEPGLEAGGVECGGGALEALDFSWGAILNQDIEVGGVRVKTEDIIDHDDGGGCDSAASPITELSPPPSDTNSDIGLDELLGAHFNTDLHDNSNEPVDLSSGAPLDLSIQGVSLKPPEWWAESFNGGLLDSSSAGLHTPISPSPGPPEVSHPWAEDKSDLDEAIASFNADISSLFDMGGHSPAHPATHDPAPHASS